MRWVTCFAALSSLSLPLISAMPTTELEARQNRDAVSELLDRTLDAMGGAEAIDLVEGLTLRSPRIFRSQTLTQNYDLLSSDRSVAEAGSQNLSFAFAEDHLTERIDRSYRYNDYWIWAHPDLKPDINYTLVVQDGPNASACFVKGQNVFYAEDPSVPAGFTDPYLTNYLVRNAQQYALIGLLKRFLLNETKLIVSTAEHKISNTTFDTLRHPDTELELLIDRSTQFPYAIRSHENHAIFGPSTSDLVFANYSELSIDETHSLMFPLRYLTAYNDESVLEDFIVDEVIFNPAFTDDFFSMRFPSPKDPSATASTEASPPQDSDEYPLSEIHEFYETGLWSGPFTQQFNTSDVVVAPVFPNGTTPQIMNLFVGYPDYVQLFIEFADGLLITDAPAHRSKIILDWLRSTEIFSGKTVKWVVPSHHHRDHADGVRDYLAAGATLVVPEFARDFYQGTSTNDLNVTTYTEDAPFHMSDGNVQFSSFWAQGNPHAADWSFGVASPACPQNDNEFVIFIADVVSPGQGEALTWDVGLARQCLIQAAEHGVPRAAVVVGAHGSSELGLGTQDDLSNILDIAGLRYPENNAAGAKAWC